MKIVIDTNVLISATFWNGASSEIINKVEENEIELILSEDIFKEYCEVLDYEEIQNKIKNKNLEMKRSAEKILSISSIIVPKNKFEVIKEDIEDNKILECAVEGNVNYIVTQDNHLLKLKKFENIKILDPKEFIEILNNLKIRQEYLKKSKKIEKQKGIEFKDIKELKEHIEKENVQKL